MDNATAEDLLRKKPKLGNYISKGPELPKWGTQDCGSIFLITVQFPFG